MASLMSVFPSVSAWTRSQPWGEFALTFICILHRFRTLTSYIHIRYRVVYNPFLDQLYHAVRGQGAFLNKTTKLPLSQPQPLPLNSLGEALIAVEWGSDRSREVRNGRAYMNKPDLLLLVFTLSKRAGK